MERPASSLHLRHRLALGAILEDRFASRPTSGIVGLKPSHIRLTRMGFAVPRMRDRNGQIAIQGAAGPMARTVEDCRLMMSALLADKCFQKDPYVPPVPFNIKIAETGLGRSLCIGVFTTDNWFQPSDA